MADIEQEVRELTKKVDELEKKVNKIELDTTKALGDIKVGLAEIKALIMKDKETGNKDNDIIMDKVKSNTDRITKIENIISKIVWTIVGGDIVVLGGAIIFYLQHKP